MTAAVQQLLDRERDRIDRRWQRRIERYAKRLQTAWERFSDDLDAAVKDDLEAEELAPLFAAFANLRRLGVRFDPRFIARMGWLERNAVKLNIDGDDDSHDEKMLDDGFASKGCKVDAVTAAITYSSEA